MTTQARKITRDLGAAETWLRNWNKRRLAELKRNADRLAELEEERVVFVTALEPALRTTLVTAQVPWADLGTAP